MIKQAFEVYTLVGGGYNKRLLHGYAWSKGEADIVGGRSTQSGQRYHVGSVHLIKLNGQWHRVNVHPVTSVYGDESKAEISRIELNDIPARKIPSILVRCTGNDPVRIPLNLEKAINVIAGIPCRDKLILYTNRNAGPMPLTFTSAQLREDEVVQEKVVKWLIHEIDFRKDYQEPNSLGD